MVSRSMLSGSAFWICSDRWLRFVDQEQIGKEEAEDAEGGAPEQCL